MQGRSTRAERSRRMLPLYKNTLSLISRDFGIDIDGPALDPAGQGFRLFDALDPEPRRCVQTAHAMVAIANYFVHIRKRLQACRQGPQRNEFRTLDSAKLMLPGFPHINENQLIAAVK